MTRRPGNKSRGVTENLWSVAGERQLIPAVPARNECHQMTRLRVHSQDAGDIPN